VIEYDGDQGFGFQLRGGGKRNCGFHRLFKLKRTLPVSSAGRELRKGGDGA
jgi:hypothetical protein